MSLKITKAETQPNRRRIIRSDGRCLEESIRMSTGIFETPYGEMEFDKYFTTKHTLKERADFIVIRTDEVPALDETIARINRAALLGERAIRQCDAVLGARVKPEAAVCETNGDCISRSSTDLIYGVVLPLAVSDLAEVEELDVKEDGEGLYWLRISNRHFDLYADNPAMDDHQHTLGIFIATESPGVASADLNHIRWQYADALLTPTTAELPGALGDVSLRSALLGLKPGVATI